MSDGLRDPQLGVSIQFIRQWNPEWAKLPTQADVYLMRRAMRIRAEITEIESMYVLPSPPECADV